MFIRYLIKGVIISSSLRVPILGRNTRPRYCDTKKLSLTLNKKELLCCLRLRNLDAVPIRHKQQTATLES